MLVADDLPGEHFAVDVEVMGGEAAVVVLDLAALVIVGVSAGEGLGRVELLLEVAVVFSGFGGYEYEKGRSG